MGYKCIHYSPYEERDLNKLQANTLRNKTLYSAWGLSLCVPAGGLDALKKKEKQYFL